MNDVFFDAIESVVTAWWVCKLWWLIAWNEVW